jgi:hypothetical protein
VGSYAPGSPGCMAQYAVEIAYQDSSLVTLIGLPDASHEDARAFALQVAADVMAARSKGQPEAVVQAPAQEPLAIDAQDFYGAQVVEVSA